MLDIFKRISIKFFFSSIKPVPSDAYSLGGPVGNMGNAGSLGPLAFPFATHH